MTNPVMQTIDLTGASYSAALLGMVATSLLLLIGSGWVRGDWKLPVTLCGLAALVGVFAEVKRNIRWWLDNPNLYPGKKHYIKYGLRCKSGRHRSVTVVQLLEATLKDDGIECVVPHLDTNEDSEPGPCGCPLECPKLRKAYGHNQASSIQRRFASDGLIALQNAISIWQDVRLNN